MSKFYAVRTGRKSGVFSNWAEAEAQVKGFSGAVYKSFTTKEEALSFINDGKQKQVVKKIANQEVLMAYVDGSFNKEKGVYGSGVVIKKGNSILKEISKNGNNDSFKESYQIAGEVIGALEAISWGIEHHYSEIEIYYDYEGIEKWAKKDWQAKKEISKYYVESYDALSKNIQVHFNKVKAHSGDQYNDRADFLAKKATQSNIKSNELEKQDIRLDNSFENLIGHKRNIYMNILIGGKVISSSEIYNVLKMKWKKRGYLIKEIQEVKIVCDLENNRLIAKISSSGRKAEYIYMEGEEING